MKYDSLDDTFACPVFGRHDKLGTLEQQLYGHVLDAIDWDALHDLECATHQLISDEIDDDDLASDLAVAVMERALHRAAEDSKRYGDAGPPHGVTEAEARAVAFDEECPYCREFRRREQEPPVEHVEEPCPCCDDLVASWREEHAAVLAKAGLGPPSAASAIAGAIEIAKRSKKRNDDSAS